MVGQSGAHISMGAVMVQVNNVPLEQHAQMGDICWILNTSFKGPSGGH
jgi:hypothetical protein